MKSNNMKRRFLVGDIGGTKTELALVTEGNFFERFEKFPSKEFGSLEEIIIKFLGDTRVDVVCFGIAGPIKDGVCHTTNLPWVVECKNISKLLNTPAVLLVNDMTASAYAISKLPESSFYTLNKGSRSIEGNQAIISPGTGLGEALMIYYENKHIPIASEGGHSDFAPRNEKEIELLRYLRNKYSHVSYERILSGPGISDLYSFLTKGEKKKPEEITKEAMSLKEPNMSKNTLKWFCEILGSEAGNLALKGYATGGIYIGGGIPLKILEILKEEDFMRGFLDKGRFKDVLKNIPIYIVLDPQSTLFGALFFCEQIKK